MLKWLSSDSGLATLITVAGSIICGVVTIFVRYVFDARLQRRGRNVLLAQLENLYAPIDRLLVVGQDAQAKEAAIRRIIDKHYALVPPELLAAWLRTQETHSDDALQFFGGMVGTYFETARKKLGYPYDRERIDAGLVPRESTSKAAGKVALSISLLTICVAELSVVSGAAGKSIFPRPISTVLSCVFFAGAYLLVCCSILAIGEFIHGRPKK